MSKLLFLTGPAYGHVTPTLEIVNELVKQGEEVFYFCTEEFRAPIVETGAEFKTLKHKEIRPNLGRGIDKNSILFDIAIRTFISYEDIVKDILEQIKDLTIDYIIFDSMFPVGKMIADILKVPSISSFAVFATKEELNDSNSFVGMDIMKNHPDMGTYLQVVKNFETNYGIRVPKLEDLLYNFGDLNIVYTSEYFLPNKNFYDSSFRFIGGPKSTITKQNDFPFEKLEGKKVIYISLGTAFNGMYKGLYQVFFDAFRDEEVVVVIAAFNMDTTEFNIPENYIVSNYVPQKEILDYALAAVTHGGLNTTSDLVYKEVPFVMLPIGGDQPYMSNCFKERGATIVLDKDKITTEYLKEAINVVIKDDKYLENIKKIRDSFETAGGSKKAAEEIFKFMKLKKVK